MEIRVRDHLFLSSTLQKMESKMNDQNKNLEAKNERVIMIDTTIFTINFTLVELTNYY